MADNFRENIRATIIENRPQLSPSSLRTYISTLFNLHKHLKQQHSNLAWFNDSIDDILDYLKDKPSQSRKSILSGALFVVVLTVLKIQSLGK